MKLEDTVDCKTMIFMPEKQHILEDACPDGALTREWIESHTIHLHRTAGGTRPDLRVVEWNGKRIAVKDFRNSSPAFREIVGRILVRREHGALMKLVDVQGVPNLIGRIDAYALAMEHIPHHETASLVINALDNKFYEQLKIAVHQIHERGVAHCDLRTFGNVLAGEDGMPYIVDFAACVYKGKGINPISYWLFRQFVSADNNAVLRVKRRFSPALLTEAEQLELAKPLPFERPAKAVGLFIRGVVKRIAARSSARRNARV
jgi:hypothetical protein